jgi:hypothetical protein
MTRRAFCVSVAFASGADIQAWVAFMSPADRESVETVLAWLTKLGHVAAFSLLSVCCSSDGETVVTGARTRLGDILIDSVVGCDQPVADPAPSFLIPVWDFEDDDAGYPTATARFLGLDVELSALPSDHDEVGFTIFGRESLSLPLIQPWSAWPRR